MLTLRDLWHIQKRLELILETYAEPHVELVQDQIDRLLAEAITFTEGVN